MNSLLAHVPELRIPRIEGLERFSEASKVGTRGRNGILEETLVVLYGSEPCDLVGPRTVLHPEKLVRSMTFRKREAEGELHWSW